YNTATQCIEIYNGSAWDNFCKDSTNAFSFTSESYFEVYETVDFFHIVKTENGQGKVSFKMIDSPLGDTDFSFSEDLLTMKAKAYNDGGNNTYKVTIEAKDEANVTITQDITVKILDVLDVNVTVPGEFDLVAGIIGSNAQVTAYCNSLDKFGKTNWRLPTIEDYDTLRLAGAGELSEEVFKHAVERNTVLFYPENCVSSTNPCNAAIPDSWWSSVSNIAGWNSYYIFGEEAYGEREAPSQVQIMSTCVSDL
ncbi:MAG: hypothetical protein ACK5HU_07555, partial [Flavobacteriales bacterium]